MSSLLDRLFDDAPDQTDDLADDAYRAGASTQQSLKRDLEALLNTRRPYTAWADQVGGSVASFGLPDITTEDFSSPTSRAAIARNIAQCVQRFEPRLSKVEVEFDPFGSVVSGVRFRIRAILKDSDEKRPVEYGARLRPLDRNIIVDSAL